MWTKIEVGQPSPFPRYTKDGAILEMGKDGVFTLLIYLLNMTDDEANIISKGDMLIKAYCDDGKMLLLVKFDSLIFDVSFNFSRREVPTREGGDERREKLNISANRFWLKPAFFLSSFTLISIYPFTSIYHNRR